MKTIQLTQDKVAIVDDVDYSYLMQWSWSFDGNYAVRNARKDESIPRKRIRLHREVLERKLGYPIPEGMYCDHINGDKLDNRRANLRLATNQQNQRNSRKQNNNTSNFRGICKKYFNNRPYWLARIQIDKNTRLTKTCPFTNEGFAKACAWRRQMELKYFGDFAPSEEI